MAFSLNLSVPKAAQIGSPKPKRDALFGTGITKKLAEQGTKLQAEAQILPSVISSLVQNELQILEHEDIATLPTSLLAEGITLDEYQTLAVQGLVNQKFAVLVGAAGTGKTTATKAFVEAIKDQVHQLEKQSLHTLATNEKNEMDKSILPAIAFCAPTGKAAQQIKRALPQSLHPLVSTIHKLLGFAPVYEEREIINPDGNTSYKAVRVFRPAFTAQNKLPFKIIVIDEAGNVAVSLWHLLLDACLPDTRIFLIGDLNQLPPVNGHSILGFAMQEWPTFALEKLHRQAEGDPIAENAHRILAGKKPVSDMITKRFFVKDIDGGSSVVKLQTLGIIRHMAEHGLFNPLRDVLIVPQNKTEVGQIELNRILVNYFNPVKKDENGNWINPRVIIVAGYEKKVFGVGDKVMLLKNNNDLGLTNGMMGIVTEIVNNNAYTGERAVYAAEETQSQVELDLSQLDNLADEAGDLPSEETEEISKRQASHILKVKFQNIDEAVDFKTAGDFTTLAFGYAITCHKAQGSEFENVVILAHSVNLKMLCREWLYTAVTRARKSVVILTNNRGLTYAVNNQRIKGATLKEKAKKFIELSKAAKGEPVARLPAPVEIKDVVMNFNERP